MAAILARTLNRDCIVGKSKVILRFDPFIAGRIGPDKSRYRNVGNAKKPVSGNAVYQDLFGVRFEKRTRMRCVEWVLLSVRP